MRIRKFIDDYRNKEAQQAHKGSVSKKELEIAIIDTEKNHADHLVNIAKNVGVDKVDILYVDNLNSFNQDLYGILREIKKTLSLEQGERELYTNQKRTDLIAEGLKTINKEDYPNLTTLNISLGTSKVKSFIDYLKGKKAIKNLQDLSSIKAEDLELHKESFEKLWSKYKPDLDDSLSSLHNEIKRLQQNEKIAVVFGSGNNEAEANYIEQVFQEKLDSDFSIPFDERRNLFATKDSIVVGAAENRKEMTIYSSQGWIDVTTYGYSHFNGEKTVGTSNAAPRISALTSELMKRYNDVAKVEEKLREIAFDSPGIPASFEGAGFINVDATGALERLSKI